MLQIFKYAEEKGKEEGLKEAAKEMIAVLLEVKFGEEGVWLLPQVGKISDFSQLNMLKEILRHTKDFGKVKEMIEQFASHC